MTTIFNTVRDAANAPVKGAIVKVDLLTNIRAGSLGFNGAAHATVVSTAEVVADNAGYYSLDLVANSALTPAGSVYRISEPGGGWHRYVIVVPATGGPYWTGDILAVAPPTGPLVAVGADSVNYDGSAWSPPVTKVSQALDAIEADGAGGGGTVQSVAGVSPDGSKDIPEASLATALGLASLATTAALTSEASTRAAADSTLTTAVAGKQAHSTALDAVTGVNTGDQDLSGLATTSALTSEATTRASGDTTNANAITAEASTARAAESANATAITSEATTRASADTTNANAITSEATTRAAADTTNANAITAEASTARAAESTNATAISTETSRAQTAEALKAPLASPTFTGHPTVEGVTSTGATGTGKFVFDGSPTLVTPNLGTPSAVNLANGTALPAAGVTGTAVVTADSRLSDARIPTGTAGGALTGTYPSPTLAAGAVRTYGGLITLGHSYTQVGGGGDGSSTFPADTLTNFTHRVAAALGIPAEEVFLLGRSGAAASSPDDASTSGIAQGTGMVLKHILPNHVYSGLITPPIIESGSSFPGLFVIMQGFNDILFGGSVAEWTQNGRNAFRWGMRVYASRPKAKSIHLYNDAALVYGGSGSWATNAQTVYSTRGTTERNSTSGGTLTYTIPKNFTGGVVAICLFGNPNGYTTTTNGATSTSLPVASRSQFPSSGNFDILVGGVAATVSGGQGTGAGTFTLTGSITWTNGAVVTRAAAGVVNWTGTAQSSAPTCSPSAPSTTQTTISGQGRAGYPIPVVVRFTGLTRADAGKTIVGTSASLGTNEYFELDSVWIEDPTPPTVLLLNQPYGPFAVGSGPNTVSATDNLNADIATVAAEHTEGYTAVVDLNAQFNKWFGATITATTGAGFLSADIASGVSSIPVTNRSPFPQSGNFKMWIMVSADQTLAEEVTVTGGWGAGAGSFTISSPTVNAHTAAATRIGVSGFDITLNDATSKIGAGSLLRIGSETMPVRSATAVSGLQYTVDTIRGYDGNSSANMTDSSGIPSTLTAGAVINDVRWFRPDKVHPSDFGHRLITQLVLEKAATIAQTSYQIANAGAYVAKRQPGVRNASWLTQVGPRNLGAAGFGTANVEYASPFYLPSFAVLTELGFWVEVLSASTGAVGRLGIRLDSGNGTPGFLLADFGQTAGDITTTGFKNITGLWQPLKPGWFWLCFIPQGTWPAATVKLTDLSQLSGTGLASPYPIGADSSPTGNTNNVPARYPPIGFSYACTATFTGAFDSQWMNPFTTGATQAVLTGSQGKSDEVPIIWAKFSAPIRD